MKNLFYLLPFVLLLWSCSDDDNDTKDVDYTVIANLQETYNNPATYDLQLITGENWFFEDKLYSIIITHVEKEGNTLTVHLGNLEYLKNGHLVNTSSCFFPGYATAKPITLPKDVTRIVLKRKQKENIYNINIINELINVVPETTSFSQFAYNLYMPRPENIICVSLIKDENLTNKLVERLKQSVNVQEYNYDASIIPLWGIMNSQYMRILKYEHENDYEKIIASFTEFAKENESLIVGKSPIYLYDWKDRDFSTYQALRD